MLNPNDLIILKKYKDSNHEYYTETIFKLFILDLYYELYKNIDDDNDYKRLFLPIFINNITKYL